MTIKDIAAIAGVSASTVSKVMNNKDQNITPQTRARILETVKKYNYLPYHNLQPATSVSTFLLALVLSGRFARSNFIKGFVDTAQEHGYSALVFNNSGAEQEGKRIADSLSRLNIDGAILEPMDHMPELDKTLQKKEIPYFLFDAFQTGAFSVDYSSITKLLTEKLMGKKHREIALVLPAELMKSACVESFRQCHYDNNIVFHDNQVFDSGDEDLTQKLIRGGYTGAVCLDCTCAIKLYTEMEKLGLQTPEDYSIVSVLSDDFMDVPFDISGIHLSEYDIGTALCSMLIDLVEKKQQIKHYEYLPPDLVISDSTVSYPKSFRKDGALVVGSIHIDMLLDVDSIPQTGKTTRIHQATTCLGGKGANEAIGIRKLKHDVYLLGKVGNDIDSRFALQGLARYEVSTRRILSSADDPTGRAYIYIEENGESTISVLGGSNTKLAPEDIRQQAALFDHVRYCLISTEIPIPTCIEAASIAKANHVQVIVKPAALYNIPPELYRNIDIFIPNRMEAAILCPQHSEITEQADYFLSCGVKSVIITLGEEGFLYKSAAMQKKYSAVHFDTVDTTGGADAFIAALTAYLLEGCETDTALRAAAYAAAYCVSGKGVSVSLVDKETLEKIVQEHDPDLYAAMTRSGLREG